MKEILNELEKETIIHANLNKFNNYFLVVLWLMFLINMFLNGPKFIYFLVAVGFLISILITIFQFKKINDIENLYDKYYKDIEKKLITKQ